MPGIVGYRGDGLNGGADTDPQTLPAPGTDELDVNVNANQTAPNTFTASDHVTVHTRACRERCLSKLTLSRMTG